MTINSIHRIIPCLPEIRTFNLLSATEEVTVEVVATTRDDNSKLITLCTRKGQSLSTATLESTKIKDAVFFAQTLWDMCKDNTNYTLGNITRIGTQMGKLFPNLARNRSVVDAIEETLALDWEHIDAYLIGTKSSVRKPVLGGFPESAPIDNYKANAIPQAFGSLTLH